MSVCSCLSTISIIINSFCSSCSRSCHFVLLLMCEYHQTMCTLAHSLYRLSTVLFCSLLCSYPQEIPLSHASDIYHIDSFIWDAPKTAIFVGLQNDYMSEHNWQLHQQQQQQQQQAYMLQQALQSQPHPHGSQQQLDDNGNCNGQRQILDQNQSQSQSQSQSNGDGSTSGGSGSVSAFNSHYSNHRSIGGGGVGGGVGAYVGCHTTSKQDGNDNLYIHGLNCDNANGSCSACTYHPNVVNFNDDESVIVTNRNGREYPLDGGCDAGAYPPELVANSYGYDVTPVSTDSITSSKSSPTTATN